ncbi:Acyl carrier protein [Falsiruegeria litorea R37]|uniref:Acyl carrier protein n=1 Tax=Falsiruegeria litorea R37 TaxID=1200284 RepID=A0A1Y5TGB5_9RHOB|nr:hypothetical protein [Falsiruegeria litorea]SLN63340.1 Acyl carrier protein [Falsiruegeria litorea R37]
MGNLNANRKSSSVGIVGDSDDVELIEYFEEVFAITFSNKEAENISTLGEAYKTICSKLPPNSEQRKRCLTAMAYYRLNRALCENGKIHPSVCIEVPSAMTPKDFQKQLEDRSHLHLEFLTGTSSWVTILTFLQFVTWIVGPLIFSGSSAVAASLSIFAISHAIWRIAERSDKRVWIFEGTIGDLSRRASDANIGELVLLGGKWKDADVWQTMTAIISDFTGYPSDQMKPETKFI